MKINDLIEPKQTLCNVNKVFNEYHITFVPTISWSFKNFLIEITELIENEKISILQLFVFGSIKYLNVFLNEFKYLNMEIPPYTWVGNENTDDFYGIYLHAIKNTKVIPIKENNKIIGNIYSDDYVKYCYMDGILPDAEKNNNSDETKSVLNKINYLLENAGMEMIDIVRTWFYNKNILAWYDTFNKIRTSFYKEKKIFQNIVPASTGIDGVNPMNKSLISSLLAIEALNGNTTVKEVDSPLQSSACNYGSSFSRATEIKTPWYRKIFISGTASINEEGKTIYLNNLEKQVEQTLLTVKELLNSVDMSFNDVTRAFAYCKTEKEYQYFKKYADENPLFKVPVIITQNIICRDNLLFELEVDAIKKS